MLGSYDGGKFFQKFSPKPPLKTFDKGIFLFCLGEFYETAAMSSLISDRVAR